MNSFTNESSALKNSPLADDLPDDLPGFDLAEVLDRLSGNRSLLIRLLLSFAEKQSDTLTQLDALFAANENAQAAALLHNIKGVASNLSAAPLAQAAASLEQEVKAGGQRLSYAAFAASLEAALSAIRRHIQPAATGKKTAVDCESLGQTLSALLPYLQQQELIPDALIQALQRAIQADLPGAPLARLLQQIDQFDHADALVSVTQLAADLALELEAATTQSSGKPLILLVDDAPANLHALAAVLKTNHRIKTATSGAAGLALANKEDRPQLILLDVMMHGMNGIEVLRRLRENPETEDIPVIFVSADASEQSQLDGLDLGADDYLIKPVVSIVLLARVRNLLQRKQAETDLRIAATAFESQEAMAITDAKQVILRVNQAFTRITGYSAEEAVGQTPSLLKSGRQSAQFYEAMWESLNNEGSWKGEIWNRRKNGEIYPEWLNITAVTDKAGQVINYVASFSDITERKTAEDEIQHLAFYDPLTRLPNRRLLLDRLHHALAASARSGRHGALLFIDLDNFKTLNDTLGHDKGDLLLQQVASRLPTCVRESDTVARLGGDEFVVMLEDLSENPQEAAIQAEIIGENILAALNQPYQFAGHEYHSTPSIGVTLLSQHRDSVDELLKRADIAMYQAKAAGRNALRFFDTDMQTAITNRAALEADLRQGLQQQEFLLYYQAQVDGDGCLTGAEALLRWLRPQYGMASPAEFIPLAEETGLIRPLGQWVLETACAQLVAWAARAETAHLSLAVNVSARQLYHPDFVDQLLAVLDATGADPRKLKLELTESLLLHDVEDVIIKMIELKAEGVGFSLDDFGTGYSSLSYLKRLPLDQLKIDQSFVRDVFIDANDAAIARTIVMLGQSLGLAVIAEGVETAEQRDFLISQGCHAFQGYFFGRPMPLEEFERMRSLSFGANPRA